MRVANLMGTYQASLFDAPGVGILTTAGDWIAALVNGSLSVSLCVIAVAILGMMMLTGRLPLRRGLHVVLGCFLLLGSANIAAGLADFTSVNKPAQQVGVVVLPQQELAPLPPVTFDPYAGASLGSGPIDLSVAI